MQLTGKQIIGKEIITKALDKNVQSQGVDVRVIEISELSGMGYIPKEGKTKKCTSTPIPMVKLEDGNWGWMLNPGCYEVMFEEACNIPSNAVLHYDPRSSLARCGGWVFSGQFDGGFHTDNMGCFMNLTRPITIAKYACIAQARVEETYEVDSADLYNGQWQGDKQRNV